MSTLEYAPEFGFSHEHGVSPKAQRLANILAKARSLRAERAQAYQAEVAKVQESRAQLATTMEPIFDILVHRAKTHGGEYSLAQAATEGGQPGKLVAIKYETQKTHRGDTKKPEYGLWDLTIQDGESVSAYKLRLIAGHGKMPARPEVLALNNKGKFQAIEAEAPAIEASHYQAITEGLNLLARGLHTSNVHHLPIRHQTETKEPIPIARAA